MICPETDRLCKSDECRQEACIVQRQNEGEALMRRGSRPEAVLVVAFLVVGNVALYGLLGFAVYLLVQV